MATGDGSGSFFGFQSEPTDATTGLVDMRSRNYDPLLGRLLTQDSQFGSLSSPMSLNQFAYAGGNPLTRADPSGQRDDADSGSCPNNSCDLHWTRAAHYYQSHHLAWHGQEIVAPNHLHTWRTYLLIAGMAALILAMPAASTAWEAGTVPATRASISVAGTASAGAAKVTQLVSSAAPEASADLSVGADSVGGTLEAAEAAAEGGPWFEVSNATANRAGTLVPTSFDLSVAGEDFSVVPNATKHIAEYATSTGAGSMPFSSLAGAVETAVDQGLLGPGRNFLTIGDWELGIDTTDNVIYHAVYRP